MHRYPQLLHSADAYQRQQQDNGETCMEILGSDGPPITPTGTSNQFINPENLVISNLMEICWIVHLIPFWELHVKLGLAPII